MRAGAKGDVNIVSATDTYENHTTNKSSSGSIGVSYGAQGWGVSVSGQMSKGNSDTVGTTQVNSHVTGSESVTIVSGNDTNILGGVVSGGKVSADIGGNLNLASRQDTEESHAEQKSAGGGLSISQGGGASGSFSASKGKADSSYANVTEQSGILAGDGGFDINVKGNTDLKGAIIASTATEDRNQLTTGTLSWSDIENKSDYSSTSMGVTGGLTFGQKVEDKTSGPTSGKNTGGVSPMIPQHESGSQHGVAQSGIAAGTITITDQASQNQDIAALNRDTANTNTTVGKGPDLNNVLGKQADMMAAAQAAGEAVAKSIGELANSKKAEADKVLAKAQERFDADPSEVNKASRDSAASDVAGWGEGGAYRIALHAAGGAMVAGLGGGSALAGGAGAGIAAGIAPQLNSLSNAAMGITGDADVDRALGNTLANLVAGGLGSLIGGGSGAATAANEDRFNRSSTCQGTEKCETAGGVLGLIQSLVQGQVVIHDGLADLGYDVKKVLQYGPQPTYINPNELDGPGGPNTPPTGASPAFPPVQACVSGPGGAGVCVIAPPSLGSANGIFATKDGGKANTDNPGNGSGVDMLGANGPKVASKTLWKGEGSERIDVENPNPGQRPGQIHYQDNAGTKYLYDPNTNSFPDAPRSVNKLLDDPRFNDAIQKAMTKYLGEKK
nr:hemagglutinin repeat-containing protein [Cupriavidus pampae]